MIDNEYLRLKERLHLRTIASDVINSLPTCGWWVKDLDFIFYDISEKASDILYNMKSDDCIWKTDFQIAQECWYEKNEAQFAEVCRWSDIYVLNNPNGDKYHNHIFFEYITDTKWNKHIWKTIKWIYPNEVWEEKYFYGMAVFMDELYWWYENAHDIVQKELPNLIKLTNSLYVYK